MSGASKAYLKVVENTLVKYDLSVSCYVVTLAVEGMGMKLDRLFEIIYILLEHERVTASMLAKRFEVSPRTIFRDVETLSAAGIPIYMSKGKGGGISLLPGFVLNKALLTEAEKADVLASLRALGQIMPGAQDGALRKLGSLLGQSDVDWIEVDFTSWQNPRQQAKLFRQLKIAILEQRIVSFKYAGGSGEIAVRTVEPLKLCFKGQGWYLFGYCRMRHDFRFYKLRRIKELTVTEERFERAYTETVLPEGGGQPFDMVELVLWLPERMAFRVYDEFESFEQLEDGSFIARIHMPSSDWAFSYVTSFGEHCELLAPPELRAELADRLRKMLQQYSKYDADMSY